MNGKKKRQIEIEVRKQYYRADRDEFASLTRAAEKQDKMERVCCEVICGAPNDLERLWKRLH